MKTIINLFHPNFKQSRVNKGLADQVKGEFEVRNLAELYPDFMIDVKKSNRYWKKRIGSFYSFLCNGIRHQRC